MVSCNRPLLSCVGLIATCLTAAVVLFSFEVFQLQQKKPDPCLIYGRAFGSLENTFSPTFLCSDESRVGSTLRGHGDGKWVCSPQDAYNNASSRCLVYSVGSNDQWDFELGVLEHNPGCEIHTFDPTVSKPEHKPAAANVVFHKIGLGRGETSLTDMILQLGHSGRLLSSLKVDCEGCEVDLWEEIRDARVNTGADFLQVHVEVHYYKQSPLYLWADFFTGARRAGFAMFHKEPNWDQSPCTAPAVEFAFVNAGSAIRLRSNFGEKL